MDLQASSHSIIMLRADNCSPATTSHSFIIEVAVSAFQELPPLLQFDKVIITELTSVSLFKMTDYNTLDSEMNSAVSVHFHKFHFLEQLANLFWD